ncbi:MAG: VWA domain-containing protein [Planctomycetota bacterium]|jgi:hypothetical protein
MTLTSLPLFAQGVTRTTFEWGRIQDPVDWILPIVVFLVIGVFVWAMYRRDAVELHPLLAWLLVALRTAAFLGLLIYYLQPQWRTEHEVVHNSRALLLVDTSLSMGLTDAEPPAAEDAKSRAGQVASALTETDLLDQLRKTHDVLVFRFNETLDRDRVVFDKLLPRSSTDKSGQLPGDAPDVEDPTATDDPETTADGPVDWSKFLAPGGAETQLGTALSQLINDQSGAPLSGIVVFTDGGQNAGIAPEAAIELARKAKIPILTVGVGSDRKQTNVRVSDLVAPARAYRDDDYLVTSYIQAQGMAGQVVEVQLLSRESGDGSEPGPGSGQIESRHQVTLGGDGEMVPVKFELTPEETGRRTLCFRIQAASLKELPRDRNPADNQREAEIEIVDHKNRVLIIAGGPTREYRFLRTLLYRDRSTVLDVLLQTAQPGISQEADNVLDDFPITRKEMFEYDCVVAFDPDWQALSVEQIELLESWVAEKGGGLIAVAGPVFTGTTIGGWVEDKNMASIRALYPVEFHRVSMLHDGMETADEPWPLEFTREGLEAEFLWLEDTAGAGREVWAGFSGVFSHCPVKGPKPGATVLARFSDPRTGSSGQLPVFFAGQFYGSGRVFYVGSGEMWRLRRLDPVYFERFYTKLIRHVSQGRLLRQSSRGVLLAGRERYLVGNTVEVRAQLTNARLEPLEAPNVPLQVIHPDKSVQTVMLDPDPNRLGTYAGRFPVLEEGPYQLDLAIPESEDEHLTRRIHVDVPDLERENPQRNNRLLSWIAERTTYSDKDGNIEIPSEYYVGLGELLQPPPPKRALAELLRDRTRTIMLPAPPGKLTLRWLLEKITPHRILEQDWFQEFTGRTWARRLLSQTVFWVPLLVLSGLLCLEWLIRRLARLA